MWFYFQKVIVVSLYHPYFSTHPLPLARVSRIARGGRIIVALMRRSAAEEGATLTCLVTAGIADLAV